MTKLLVIITTILCTLSSFAGYTLQWEKDLTDYTATTNLTEYFSTAQYADGSIAVSFCPRETSLIASTNNPDVYVITNTVVVFNSDGSLKLLDSFETTTFDTTVLVPRSIAGNLKNVNVIITQSHWSSGNKDIRICEITDTTNVITTLNVQNISSIIDLISPEGDPSIFVTVEEGKMLRVYRFDSVPAVIDASVASGIDGSNYIMSWDSNLGVDYQIQSSDNLTNNWVDVGSAITGTGDTLTWANALTNSQSFYRVVEQ